MDALNPAKRRAAQRPTPQRVYVKVTSEFDATGYMPPATSTNSPCLASRSTWRACMTMWMGPIGL